MTRATGLRRFREPAAPAAQRAPAERCEMCGTEVPHPHGHVVDIEHRALMCACRACYLLFTRPDAGAGRYRAVPRRYLVDPSRPMTAGEWARLGVPVASAFFLRGEDGVAGFYPSPAGATECLLDLSVWAELVAAHPLLDAAEPDVEAVLVRNSDTATECYLVPVDECYRLVGLVRTHWKGFDGGEAAHEHIAAFFADLRARAATYSPEA